MAGSAWPQAGERTTIVEAVSAFVHIIIDSRRIASPAKVALCTLRPTRRMRAKVGSPRPLWVMRVEFVMFVNVRFQGDFGHSNIGWWLYAARDSRLRPVTALTPPFRPASGLAWSRPLRFRRCLPVHAFHDLQHGLGRRWCGIAFA
jgi:hypothetical protein